MDRQTLKLALMAACTLAVAALAYKQYSGPSAAVGTSQASAQRGAASTVHPAEPGADDLAPSTFEAPVSDAATVATAAPNARLTGELLPAEKVFIANGQLQLAAVQQSLTSKQFEQQMQLLEQQMASSPDAMDLADTYRSAIAEQLEKAQTPNRPERFACGTGLCMGTLRSQSDTGWYKQWWSDFTESSSTTHTIALDYALDQGGGNIEHRFIFVTDPAVNSVVQR